MEIFFNPLFIFWLFIATFFAFKKAGLKRISRIFLIIAFGELLLCTCTPLPEILVFSLENRYRVFKPANINKEYYIMVLDGGHSDSEALPVNQLLNASTLIRLSEGIRIHKMFKNSRLICSGDSNKGNADKVRAITGTANIMGAGGQNVISFVKSANTDGEAVNFKKHFGTGKNIILVTSAIHMPRAVKIFNNHGLRVVPAPSDFYIKNEKGSISMSFLPGYMKIRNMEKAMHEYAGIFYYTYIN